MPVHSGQAALPAVDEEVDEAAAPLDAAEPVDSFFGVVPVLVSDVLSDLLSDVAEDDFGFSRLSVR